MSSAREPPSPVVIDPLVAQAVDDLVAAVDRTHCGVVVHGCALTLTAGASMIDNGALQMYEQIDIGGVVLALGDAITLLPGGKPIMFFGAFVKDDNVFIAGVVVRGGGWRGRFVAGPSQLCAPVYSAGVHARRNRVRQ